MLRVALVVLALGRGAHALPVTHDEAISLEPTKSAAAISLYTMPSAMPAPHTCDMFGDAVFAYPKYKKVTAGCGHVDGVSSFKECCGKAKMARLGTASFPNVPASCQSDITEFSFVNSGAHAGKCYMGVSRPGENGYGKSGYGATDCLGRYEGNEPGEGCTVPGYSAAQAAEVDDIQASQEGSIPGCDCDVNDAGIWRKETGSCLYREDLDLPAWRASNRYDSTAMGTYKHMPGVNSPEACKAACLMDEGCSLNWPPTIAFLPLMSTGTSSSKSSAKGYPRLRGGGCFLFSSRVTIPPETGNTNGDHCQYQSIYTWTPRTGLVSPYTVFKPTKLYGGCYPRGSTMNDYYVAGDRQSCLATWGSAHCGATEKTLQIDCERDHNCGGYMSRRGADGKFSMGMLCAKSGTASFTYDTPACAAGWPPSNVPCITPGDGWLTRYKDDLMHPYSSSSATASPSPSPPPPSPPPPSPSPPPPSPSPPAASASGGGTCINENTWMFQGWADCSLYALSWFMQPFCAMDGAGPHCPGCGECTSAGLAKTTTKMSQMSNEKGVVTNDITNDKLEKWIERVHSDDDLSTTTKREMMKQFEEMKKIPAP